MLKLLGLLALAAACALSRPAQRDVVGRLVAVTREWKYEAPCTLQAQLLHVCDDLPVCCAYRVRVALLAGGDEYFEAFWPASQPGLLGLVALGDTAAFRLHLRPLFLLPCTMYGCAYDVGYALDADADVAAPRR